MARFSGSSGGGEGTAGPEGPAGANGTNGADGADGADALWNFTGEYSGGAAYAVGDIATYDGQLWYRFNSNGGNVGDTPSPGLWNLLAAKGAAGADGDDGATGSPGLVYLGNYVSGNGYIANIAVVKGSDNNLYIATSSGGLGDPIGNTAEWSIFLPKGTDGAPGADGADGGDIADFVFTNVDETNSSITVTGDKEVTIQSGATNDLNVRAGDDLWLTADDNILVQANDGLQLRSTDSTSIITNYVDLENAEHEWLFGSQGYLTLPGGAQIVSQPNSSGDGSGFSTLELVPDGTLETNQFLIIDPTAPNHIHIRAGGEIDQSTADLIIGGERNNVRVSDNGRDVAINARPATVVNTYTNLNPTGNTSFVVSNTANIYVGDTAVYAEGGLTITVDSVTADSPEAGLQTITANLDGTPAIFVGGAAHIFTHEETWNNSWQFRSDGVLLGPAMGSLAVNGIFNNFNDSLYINSSEGVIIDSVGGEFLHDDNSPANQIATIGDLGAESTTSFQSVRYTPTFTATGLTFTGTGATHPTYNSYYVKSGKLVSFVIEVNMSTVTNFGTGQYKLQLPFTPQFGFNHFSGWAWADPDVSPDTGTGHTIINADTAGVTDVLDLHYLKSAGGANAPIREGLFVQGTPVALTTISKIYINGTYIAA